jgi:hypothetical protein
VASKSIRDGRLTGARIAASKKETAILLFADNRCATEVAKAVEISVDSARGIRDREGEQIMKLREALRVEYGRIWMREIDAKFNMQTEERYQQLWQEILKKQKTLEPSSAPASSS